MLKRNIIKPINTSREIDKRNIRQFLCQHHSREFQMSLNSSNKSSVLEEILSDGLKNWNITRKYFKNLFTAISSFGVCRMSLVRYDRIRLLFLPKDFGIIKSQHVYIHLVPSNSQMTRLWLLFVAYSLLTHQRACFLWFYVFIGIPFSLKRLYEAI